MQTESSSTPKPISGWMTFCHIRRDLERYSEQAGCESLLLLAIKNLHRHPSLAGVLFYRVGRWLWTGRRNPILFLMLVCYYLVYPLVRMYSGVELSPRADVGPGLCIMHFGPTVIHPDVSAGENLTVLHGVTIGASRTGVPRIGSGVSIGVGATILGGIVVGNSVRIGAGAVVTQDLPDNCTAVGMPARPLEACD